MSLFTKKWYIFTMAWEDCPRIIHLGGSVKDGKDEEYHRLGFNSYILFDGFCRFESEGYARQIKPGDLLIVPAGRSRVYRNPRSLISRHGHFLCPRPPEEIFYRAAGSRFREFCHVFDQLSLFSSDNPGKRTARFWLLLHQAEEEGDPQSDSGAAAVHPALSRAVEFLEFHFHEKIGMDDLARESRLSHNQLLRLFKEEYGMTPSAYLFKKRMDYAGELLTQTTLAIKEIRYKCGYTDGQHFNKAVRRYYGRPPRELRTSTGERLHQGTPLC